jgi:hypothetical protein
MEILFDLAVSLHAPQTADIEPAQDLFADHRPENRCDARQAHSVRRGPKILALSATLFYAPRKVPAFDPLQT